MRFMLVLSSATLLAGCLGEAGGLKSGGVDAGSLDGSVASDAGEVDAGAHDAGSPRPDAGPAPLDAGLVNNAPAWLTGHPLETWFELPGTSGAGGVNVDAYNGFALRDSSSELILAASGGHHDSSDNRVVSLQLASDAPVWLLRKASSTDTPINVDYYPDGLPSSRHTYQSSQVIEALHRIFLFGARFTFGDAYEFPRVDAFDLTTNQWDPAGTWASVPPGAGYGAVRTRGTEDVYTTALSRWSASTQTWSTPIASRTTDSVRWPIAYDSKRNQLFTLQWGDGQGYDPPQVSASKIPLSGTAQVRVTFSPSAALTQFEADQPSYAAMDYDPPNDRFFFYCGQGAGAGRIYVVTPNDTAVWDLSILPLGAGSVMPAATNGAGVNNRFRYVPALEGFVLLPSRDANLFFIRTH